MLIGLGKRMGSDPDLLEECTTGRCVFVFFLRLSMVWRFISKRRRPMNARDHEQQDNDS